ncbi:hypothetical protein ACFQH3_02770 [Haladaptatus sp. GCM10025707]|uniref:hypothetical protein n=1 Tax=Haladaptatus sp. GCM10025707 TaxID=3252658 RepID=UPI00361DBF6C
MRLKLFLTTFNVVLLFVLAKGYVSIYRALPNSFTRSLVLFRVALLFYALAANPAVHILLGYPQAGPGTLLGPFTNLSDLFAAIAIVALLYQSYK